MRNVRGEAETGAIHLSRAKLWGLSINPPVFSFSGAHSKFQNSRISSTALFSSPQNCRNSDSVPVPTGKRKERHCLPTCSDQLQVTKLPQK